MNAETRNILDYIDQVLSIYTNDDAKLILEELKSEIESRIDSCEDGVYTEN